MTLAWPGRSVAGWLGTAGVVFAWGLGCGAADRPAGLQSSPPASQPAPLVTGRLIDPDAASPTATQSVGSLPVNMIPVRGGRFVVSTDAGYRQALWAVSTATGEGASKVGFPNKP